MPRDASIIVDIRPRRHWHQPVWLPHSGHAASTAAGRRGFLAFLGPGLITGAADDDPSGIATYSQVGAQFGYGMTWLMMFSFPLMAAIQEVSARIGRVTGQGIAANVGDHYSPWLLRFIVLLLIVANTINLGADLGAMGAAVRLVIGGPPQLYVVLLAVVCAGLEIFVQYKRYAAILKWLTLALFAYVATVLIVDVHWREVAFNTVVPHIQWTTDFLTGVVAVLGTTISPYLFFWQASEEAEEERTDPAAQPLADAPEQAPREIHRIRVDTWVGMGLSNLVSWCIIVTTAATLAANNITNIESSEQAAEALRPIAGELAFLVFALGIVGTGLLAIPVLAGSAAYALAEMLHWPAGLSEQPHRAKAFYATIAIGTLLGIAFNFVHIDPIKALFWTAVINGVVAVPLMIVMMVMTMQPKVMGDFTLPRPLWVLGWISTAAMTVTVAAMFATWGH
ncbi:MAG TPA: Nramp family divalent metal transporter [Stellaceae bacterium]|jgi:NRAMP (natural resistance-associated macrophage protein)-like metal ion transporter|nr:Nramp family divalent metal transporter [Stellaceae bacterium]